MRRTRRRTRLAVSILAALLMLAGLASLAQANLRPKSAPVIKVSFVPAFQACNVPGNRQHGPPLAAPSCNPPVAASTAVTVGTQDVNGAVENAVGSLKLNVAPGVPGPPEDSNVMVAGSITDVRCLPGTTTCGQANTVDGADYTGGLQATANIRITDRWNAVSPGGGPDSATVIDLPFPFNFVCSNTVDVTVGGTCTTASTSFNAIVPGAIKDGKRMVIEHSQIVVHDGGPDGNISTAPNTPFMRQGVFIP
jgi:hypothetical protein